MSLSTPSHCPLATSFPPSVTEQSQLVGSPSIRLLSECQVVYRLAAPHWHMALTMA